MSKSSLSPGKTAVFLMAHGAPTSVDDIPLYLKNIRGGTDSSPEVIQTIRDRYESKGKRSGAYSSGCYDSNPFILMNYREDNINSIKFCSLFSKTFKIFFISFLKKKLKIKLSIKNIKIEIM